MEKNIRDKLLTIQTELKAPKNQYNAFGKYNYRSCEDILEALKHILQKVNCVLVISDEVVIIGARYYVKATAILKDETGEASVTAYAREEEIKKGMDGAQITGAASSYARKYALNGLFCIDDTKDADTLNNGTKQELDKDDSKKLDMIAGLNGCSNMAELEKLVTEIKPAVLLMSDEAKKEISDKYIEKKKSFSERS